MKLLKPAYHLIILLIAFSIVTAQEINTGMSVTKDGYASIIDDDIASAREEALNSALRGAVDEIMRSMTGSDYNDKQNQLAERYIFSNLNFYILQYEVLSESNDNAISYSVVTRVNIDSYKLEQDLDKIGLLQFRLSNPKILFFISEQLPDIDLVKDVSISETIIEDDLKKSGLLLISNDMGLNEVQSDETEYDYEANIEKVMVLGKMLGGDIVVIGNSKATIKDLSGKKKNKIKNIVATIGLKAVKLDNGTVLSESTASAVYPHSNLLIGIDRAIRKASAKVVKNLSEDIRSRWKTEVNSGRKILLDISNVTSFSQFNSLKSSLKNYITGNVEVESRSFNGSGAEFSVTSSTTGYKIASELEGKKIDDFNIKILSSSLYALSIALVRQ